ncbi:hypothetical protein HZH68_007507 [Vespula germanica]|uniref:Uncharacterized protein n=1 Tax=Vespula germanica TaxID=30212 RepID=A0A834NA05_VESGE|nr:hypothetical protein HZH68_007507 [Vespula germanica]
MLKMKRKYLKFVETFGVVGARNLSAMECRKGRRKGLLGGLLLAWLLTSGRTVVARNIDNWKYEEGSTEYRKLCAGKIEIVVSSPLPMHVHEFTKSLHSSIDPVETRLLFHSIDFHTGKLACSKIARCSRETVIVSGLWLFNPIASMVARSHHKSSASRNLSVLGAFDSYIRVFEDFLRLSHMCVARCDLLGY